MFYPRGEEVAARAAGARRHGLHPVDAVGLPDGGCRARRTRGRSGTSCTCSADVTRRSPRSTAPKRPATRRWSSPSTRRLPGLRERDLRNGVKALLTRKRRRDAAVHPAVPDEAALARQLPRRRRVDEVSQRRRPRRRDHAYADVGAALEKSVVAGPICAGFATRGRTDRRQGRPDGDDARRADRRGRRRDRRVEPRRAAARRRRARRCASCPRWSPPWAIKSKSCSTAASAAAATSSRRCAWAPAPCSSAAPTRTGSAPPADAGVTRAIEILRTDLVRTLKLLGCASVAELNRTYVDVPPDWR